MHQKTKDIQNRYIGFLQTPCLWKNNVVYALEQFKITSKSTKIDIEINEKLRLGKYIERLVSFQLEQDKSISILCENVQIQKEKITLGELDCILKKEEKHIHLEVIYKFYLYDESVGFSELEHWIGPNRKDSFIEKITKLKNKQLPLLYKPETQVLLDELNLKVSDIKQHVYFKAQLFVPYQLLKKPLRLVNNSCIVGYFLNYGNLDTLQEYQLYVPEKLDWLIQPHADVNWLNYEEGQQEIMTFINQEKSPLCWIKSPKGTLQKLFIVWW